MLIVTKRVCYFEHTLYVSTSGQMHFQKIILQHFLYTRVWDANLTLP